LEFKIIILEEQLSKKLKNGHKFFLGVSIFIVLGLLDGCPKTMKFRGLIYVGGIFHDRF
jgi:hypothetical protein